MLRKTSKRRKMPFPVRSLDGATSPLSVPAAPGAPPPFSHLLSTSLISSLCLSNPGFKSQTRKTKPVLGLGRAPGSGCCHCIPNPGMGWRVGRGPRGQGGLPLGFCPSWNWGELVPGEKAAGNSGGGGDVFFLFPLRRLSPQCPHSQTELHSRLGYWAQPGKTAEFWGVL